MHNSDIKILELIIHLKKLGFIKYDADFCDAIGLKKQNIAPIKKGLAHFTALHIENICTTFQVNANWIFGIESQMFMKVKSNQNSVQTIQKLIN